ncbi:hypothetical protein [Desemzia sp. FAM 23991]|uniref:hypothetical protein n=1 Tax=unclassified Desemzia TaxID=2685243 RepID=UPI0038856F44
MKLVTDNKNRYVISCTFEVYHNTQKEYDATLYNTGSRNQKYLSYVGLTIKTFAIQK